MHCFGSETKGQFILVFALSVGVYEWIVLHRSKFSIQKVVRDSASIEDELNDWKINYRTDMKRGHENKFIAEYVQTRLRDIQNPRNCVSSHKVVCDLPPGLFKTEDIPVIKAVYRTFYIDLERSLPYNISFIVKRFHSDPQLWWAGQMASYILRPTVRLNNLLANQRKRLGFKNVIVGLQIRRTDKISEAFFYNLTEYMKAAENWFDDYERKSGVTDVKRRIFIATDDPKVVLEARRMFPDYIFINDMDVTTAASNRDTRYTYSSLEGIILDTFLLSMCDYIVCTMSSNICRLAFELMQRRYFDATGKAKSLDCEYFIERLYKLRCVKKPKNFIAVQKMIKYLI